MADMHLEPSPPYGLPVPGWHGAAARAPGVVALEAHVSLYLLQPAREGGDAGLAQIAQDVGLEVPRTGCVAIAGDRRLAWSGRGTWLLVAV